MNPSGLVNLAATQLFGEVYALFVNEGTTIFTENPLNLSVQTVQQILTHKIKNWSLVTDVNGNAVTNAPLAITIVNREKGSGSRTATDLLIAGDTCQTQQSLGIKEPSTVTDYFSTGDVLNAASSTAGSITYATIDNAPVSSTQQVIAINGVAANTLNAATGRYPFWVEATVAVNPNNTLSAAQANLLTYVTTTLQSIATAPHIADINAIPNIAGNVAHVNVAGNGNTATGSLTGLGSTVIYTNPFTRNQVTCSVPSNAASVP